LKPYLKNVLHQLGCLLKPPGQGIHAVSTGKKSLQDFLKKYLGTDAPKWESVLKSTFSKSDVDRFILGIPSDTGAGIVKGAAWGPKAIREEWGKALGTELGDVFTVPHLLSDKHLNLETLTSVRRAMYPDDHARANLESWPVAPLEIAEAVVHGVLDFFPMARVLTLGGDHSVAYPVIKARLERINLPMKRVGLLHFDAHTDLLPERLGIKVCFATWTRAIRDEYFAKSPENILQLGIRASAKDRAHWEKTTGITQWWAKDIRNLEPKKLAAKVVEYFKDLEVEAVYITNDIDGTDSKEISACGTPEPGGLSSEQVLAVTRALKSAGIWPVGGDVVELAPGLSLDPKSAANSRRLAAKYAEEIWHFLGEDD
jgi:arginase family enzyme